MNIDFIGRENKQVN